MAKRSDRSSDRERFWRGVIGKWKASGQGVTAFCREEGLGAASFYAWRRRLSGETPRKRALKGPAFPSTEFTPVRVVDRNGGHGTDAVEIVLRNGRRLRLSAQFEVKFMAELAAALEAPPC